ncbi:MAG TPA: SRPBCC family protein [Candidatus Methylomirabilis sp.]|nr:SRPBCC family protein [Candidatus Methylomirabilis sp.]
MQSTGTLSVFAQSEREVVFTRTFDAPRSLLFAAWTKPELLKRWLYGPEDWPMKVCNIDLKVGGALRFERHNVKSGRMGMSGMYREIVPPDRLVFTEVWDEDWTGGEAISIESKGKTTFTQTVLYSSREARDNVLKSRMDEGAAQSYDRLAALLASPEFQSAAVGGAGA